MKLVQGPALSIRIIIHACDTNLLPVWNMKLVQGPALSIRIIIHACDPNLITCLKHDTRKWTAYLLSHSVC